MSFSLLANIFLPVSSKVKEQKTITAIIVTDTVLHNGLDCAVVGAACRRFIRPIAMVHKSKFYSSMKNKS